MPDRRWGLTLPLPGLPLADHRELVEAAERAGYTDLWSGETNGPDGFTPLALAAAWTELPFERPLSRVAETVDFVRAALAGERTPTGFRLERAPSEPPPIILA